MQKVFHLDLVLSFKIVPSIAADLRTTMLGNGGTGRVLAPG